MSGLLAARHACWPILQVYSTVDWASPLVSVKASARAPSALVIIRVAYDPICGNVAEFGGA